MCKLATESASRQPRAYMYSILFMMSMPMMLTSGFGIAFYRLSRKAARMQQEQAEDFTADGDRG
jgi:LytS/YehU family sensor histidine kinase